MLIKLDLYQTVAMAIVVFASGSKLKSKVSFFQKYCIPAPVIGGILFAVLTLIFNITGIVTIETDSTMQNVFMTLFFTSVGYSASLKLLKQGGIQVMLFTVVTTVIIFLQDVLGVTLAKFFNLDPLLGLCVGSIPLVGGHGTSGSFGPLLETEFGVTGATAVAIASATFGLIMGGLIGGPIAKRHILGKGLSPSLSSEDFSFENEPKDTVRHTEKQFLEAFSMLFVAAGIGSLISSLITKAGLTVPSYIGAMLAAALLRNILDFTSDITVMEDVIGILGSVSLTLFLSMALMSLRLWELASLAGPLVVMLFAQTVLMALFAYFVVFYTMGRNYEAAVMCSATCGFGMGATPNAIANMQSITSVYGPAPKAFFVVPIVGSLFADFVNSAILTVFINYTV